MPDQPSSALSEQEKMLSGYPYNPGDATLMALRTRARQILRRFNEADPEDPENIRQHLADLLGHHGERAWIEPPFRCVYGGNIYLQDRVYMNFDCVILDAAAVRVGTKTLFGPGVHIYTTEHPVDPAGRSAGRHSATPVTIGENAWIGGGSIILPGVTIGDDAVIGAGSVVTKDIEPGVVAVGNPARTIRRF
ncbi:MAG: sugar O-acetyltransferase [Magnetospiraceae bacterium]